MSEFTETERIRFRQLLLLAAESPFSGERENALEAARRMAERHGMSLEEAAVGGGARRQRAEQPREQSEQPRVWPSFSTAEGVFMRSLHLMEQHLHTDKARRDEALRAARERGLDAEEEQEPQSLNGRTSRRSRRRCMDPHRHAAVLLSETSLPFREIASITGLNVYQVVGLKLKLRSHA